MVTGCLNIDAVCLIGGTNVASLLPRLQQKKSVVSLEVRLLDVEVRTVPASSYAESREFRRIYEGICEEFID